MARLRLEFDADWARQKIDLASREIGRALADLRGVSNYSGIHPASDAPVEEPRQRLNLVCTANPFGRGRCGTVWEADTFTACPKCGQRRWVNKVEEVAETA